MTLSHHLAAVWFADVVGYTAQSEGDERVALELVQVFMATTREVVGRCGGRVVKFIGDGALAEFPSTDMAVRSAQTLIGAFAAAAEAKGLGEQRLRIGIHVGDVAATEDGDLFGDGVNVASRIQEEAEPGTVWVSEDVRRHLRQRREFTFEPQGERAMKGISRPLPIHAVEIAEDEEPHRTISPDLPGPHPSARSLPRAVRIGIGVAAAVVVALGAAFLAGLPPWGDRGGVGNVEASIAVLPFKDISSAGDQEYFADGMTEEVLNALTQVPDLRVAARTSSFAYKGKEIDVREVARNLGVATVLEGSVRREGDALRITAQLIDADNGFHLWSETYDRRLESVFAIQEEIAAAIVHELKGSLGVAEGERLVRNRTGDIGAYELYLRARSLQRQRGASVGQAIDLYEQALERDPAFAPAWAGLAEAWSIEPYYETAADSTYWDAALSRAEEAAATSLDIDPSLVPAHVALGNVHRDRWEWTEAEPAYRRALALDPDDPEANQQYGDMLAAMGRTEEALPYARRAVELDPLAAIRLVALGLVLHNNGLIDESIAVLQRGFEVDSTLSYVASNMIASYLTAGRYRGADRFLSRVGRGEDDAERRVIRALADPAGRRRADRPGGEQPS